MGIKEETPLIHHEATRVLYSFSMMQTISWFSSPSTTHHHQNKKNKYKDKDKNKDKNKSKNMNNIVYVLVQTSPPLKLIQVLNYLHETVRQRASIYHLNSASSSEPMFYSP